MVRLLTAMMLVALSLIVGGCGETDADGGGSSSGAGTDSTDGADQVSLRITSGGGGSRLSAANDGDSKLLVLLPVGEPEQGKSDGATSLTYVRSSSGDSGEEPELFEAAAVESGATEQLDLSTVGTWTKKVRICLEVVSPDEVAADDGGGAIRVSAREKDVEPVIACSDASKLPAG